MTQHVNWRQVFAEVGVLFAGAALALAADSWWDERRDRLEETTYLVSIREDLEANGAELDELEAAYHQVLAADSALLAYIHGSSTGLEGDSLLFVTLRAFSMHYFRPALGTYHDMIGSGSLRLIRDYEIREGLAELAETVEVLERSIELLAARWIAIEEPFMIENLPMTVMLDGYPRGVVEQLGLRVRLPPLSLPPSPEFSRQIPRTEEFANLIAVRMALVWDVLLWSEFLRKDLDVLAEVVG